MDEHAIKWYTADKMKSVLPKTYLYCLKDINPDLFEKYEAVYNAADVDLRVRLGDLSGSSSQYVRGADVKGFGLVTSDVFLTSSFFVGVVNEHISFQTGSF